MTPKKNLKSVFGSKLKALRVKNDWNQSQLIEALRSKGLELSQGAISQYENGEHCPDMDKLEIIADVFGVNPAWLIDPENEVLAEYREKMLVILQQQNASLSEEIEVTEKKINVNAGLRRLLQQEIGVKNEFISKLSTQF